MEPFPSVVEPVGQDVHSAAERRPMSAPYVPTGQGEQSSRDDPPVIAR